MASVLARGVEQEFGNEEELCQLQVSLLGNKKEQRTMKLLLGLLRCCLTHPAAALDGQNLASANLLEYCEQIKCMQSKLKVQIKSI